MQLTKELEMTQQELANRLNVSRSMVAMVQKGERKYPKECNPVISELSYKAALEIASQETGGYISNLLSYMPDVDYHPMSLKLMVRNEFAEALQALEELLMAKMTPEEKRRAVENALMEIEDAIDVANVMKGEVAKRFGINLQQLNRKRIEQIKIGERKI